MQRIPDETKDIDLGSVVAEVSTWIAPTDLPWDGTEPLPENAEGYDIRVKATVNFDNEWFTAYDSLGSIWIVPDKEGLAFLKQTQKEVETQAIASLKDEIRAIAKGRDVNNAKRRARFAAQIAKDLK